MVIRNPQNKTGAVSIQLLVILVPVLFGFMGFAVDLGRLYLVRGELNQAANAMALAAAKQLIGTSNSTANADAAAADTYNNNDGNANLYNFGKNIIGDSSAFLQTETNAVTYFADAADATALDATSVASSVDGTTALYAQANIQADAPLTFWALLALGQARKTPIAARAVAGVSAPVCTACGIEPFAIAAVDQTDTVNFGLTVGTEYTFGYLCTGLPTPIALTGTSVRLPYLILDSYNTGSTLLEDQQLFSIGAAGLLPTATPTSAVNNGGTNYGCLTINTGYSVWATATPTTCSAASPVGSVVNLLCGLTTRMDTGIVSSNSACSANTDLSTVSNFYQADTDVTNPVTDYTTYLGNTRRIITVPIIDTLSATTSMTVLGFREFLLEGSPNSDTNIPNDADGRFIALYIGNPAPVKQGRFDGGCDATSGPGKVVIFQ